MKEYTIIELIAELYKFTKKYFWIILLFAIIGIIYGIFQKRNNPVKYYEAKIYVGTGLLYNAHNMEPNINALYTDLLSISSKISDTSWVRSNFNQDSTTFIYMGVSNISMIRTRFQNLLKITLRAKSFEDFNKFKKGLVYYYKYRSPLLVLYRRQVITRKEIKGNLLRNVIKNTMPVVDTQGVGVIFSSNIYDAYIDADYSMARPLMYFTSDFTRITKKRSEQNLAFYVIVFLIIGVFVALSVELFIKTRNYLREEKNKKAQNEE